MKSRFVIGTIVVAAALMIFTAILFIAASKRDVETTTMNRNRAEWEEISGRFSSTVLRTQVPSGWLVKTNGGKAITFVPDPKHKWLKGDI